MFSYNILCKVYCVYNFIINILHKNTGISSVVDGTALKELLRLQRLGDGRRTTDTHLLLSVGHKNQII